MSGDFSGECYWYPVGRKVRDAAQYPTKPGTAPTERIFWFKNAHSLRNHEIELTPYDANI